MLRRLTGTELKLATQGVAENNKSRVSVLGSCVSIPCNRDHVDCDSRAFGSSSVAAFFMLSGSIYCLPVQPTKTHQK